MPRKSKNPATRRPPGPDPETLEIEGDWKKAVKKALGKKRPVGGWPTVKKKRG